MFLRPSLRSLIRILIYAVFFSVIMAIQVHNTRTNWQTETAKILKNPMYDCIYGYENRSRGVTTRIILWVGTNYINIGGTSTQPQYAPALISELQQILQQSGFQNVNFETISNPHYVQFGTRVGICKPGYTRTGIRVPAGAIVNAARKYSTAASVVLVSSPYAVESPPPNAISMPYINTLLSINTIFTSKLNDIAPDTVYNMRSTNLNSTLVLVFLAMIAGFGLPAIGMYIILQNQGNDMQDEGAPTRGSLLMVGGGLILIITIVILGRTPLGNLLIDAWLGDRHTVLKATDRILGLMIIPGLLFLMYGIQFLASIYVRPLAKKQ